MKNMFAVEIVSSVNVFTLNFPVPGRLNDAVTFNDTERSFEFSHHKIIHNVCLSEENSFFSFVCPFFFVCSQNVRKTLHFPPSNLFQMLINYLKYALSPYKTTTCINCQH